MPSAPKFEIDRWVSNSRPRNKGDVFTVFHKKIDLSQAESLCVEYNGYIQTFRTFDDVVDVFFEVVEGEDSAFVLVFSHSLYKSYQERFNIELVHSIYYWHKNGDKVVLYDKEGE